MRILISLLITITCLQATAQEYTSIAKEFLNQNKSTYLFEFQDINELKVTTSSFSKKSECSDRLYIPILSRD